MHVYIARGQKWQSDWQDSREATLVENKSKISGEEVYKEGRVRIRDLCQWPRETAQFTVFVLNKKIPITLKEIYYMDFLSAVPYKDSKNLLDHVYIAKLIILYSLEININLENTRTSILSYTLYLVRIFLTMIYWQFIKILSMISCISTKF